VIDGQRLLAAATGFGRELRAAGLAVGPPEAIDFVRALGEVDIGDRDQVRAASRAVHVRRHEDIATHDEVFDAYWLGRSRLGESPLSTRRVTQAGGKGDAADAPAKLIVRRTYSADEVLRRREFDHLTPDELRQAERLIDRLALSLERRPTRRFELHAHGTRLAPRPMFQRSTRTGGELLDWLWRRQRTAPRPVCLLIDISGSMETYARLMLRFAHVLARVSRRTEVFTFGTRLTRVTRQMRMRDTDAAIAVASSAVADWSGGTRIGESLGEFNRRWSGKSVPSSAIVVVLSDGWDRGDPTLVATETARLRRRCHRLIWLNPLAGAPGFEPLAAGMAAASRHVDMLLPVATLADLKDFCDLLTDTRWGAARQPLRTNSLSESIA
jgi:hypothetical protein